MDRPAPWDSETQWSRLASRYLRKEFATSKVVKRATLHIAGMGMYEAFINGTRIGEQEAREAGVNAFIAKPLFTIASMLLVSWRPTQYMLLV